MQVSVTHTRMHVKQNFSYRCLVHRQLLLAPRVRTRQMGMQRAHTAAISGEVPATPVPESTAER